MLFLTHRGTFIHRGRGWPFCLFERSKGSTLVCSRLPWHPSLSPPDKRERSRRWSLAETFLKNKKNHLVQLGWEMPLCDANWCSVWILAPHPPVLNMPTLVGSDGRWKQSSLNHAKVYLLELELGTEAWATRNSRDELRKVVLYCERWGLGTKQ
jgi:hypothetical protein